MMPADEATPAPEDAAAATRPQAGSVATPGKSLATLPAIAPAKPLDALGCGMLPTRLADQPHSLLRDRLFMQAFKGARDMVRPHSLMSAPQPSERETRLYLEHQGQKLVIMAYELFHLAGALSDEASRRVMAPHAMVPGLQLAAHRLELTGTELRAVALVPERIDTSAGDAVFVLGVITAHRDGTAQLVAFYVDPQAGASGRDCTDLALHLARTLAAGPRVLMRDAGERRLPHSGGLRLQVPADWALTTQEGPDFFVYRLVGITPLGTAQPQVGIYVGHHPSGPERGADARTTGHLLGQIVTWTGPEAEPGDPQVREVVVPHPTMQGASVHVWLVAPSSASLPAVQAVAESLQP